MPLSTSKNEENYLKVTFSNGLLNIEKPNGQVHVFPALWYPQLSKATVEELEDWSYTNKGIYFNKLALSIKF